MLVRGTSGDGEPGTSRYEVHSTSTYVHSTYMYAYRSMMHA